MADRKTLLVVDDSPEMIGLVRAVLGKHGYDVLIATDGRKALDRAAAERPDLILLDILMPGMDGYETCRRLREQPETRNLPVIFLSALTETHDKIAGFELGAVDFVTKPIDFPELLARIRTHLTLHDLRRELREMNRTLEDKVRERTRDLSASNQALVAEIEERRRTEAQLRENKERLKEAQRIARVGHWERDHVAGTLAWSDETFRIFCVDPEDGPSYRTYLDRIHPDDRERVQTEYEEAVRNRKTFDTTFRMVRRDGAVKHLHERCRTDYDAEGRPLRSIGTCQDITERVQMEEENRLLNMRLQQAQKLEAVGTLAGGIAHDFNNILAAIIGYTEISKIRHAQGGNVIGSLDSVLSASVRARNLVRHILTFSRQVDTEMQPVSVRPIVKECLAFLKASTPANIELRSSIETATGDVLGDPTQIHQITMNLCTNAVHAMKGRGGVLDVRLDEITLDENGRQPTGPENGDYLRLTVSDSGCGIPEEISGRIFDPFFTTKPRGEGTGMGLSILHGIVQKMGGGVSVSSDVGAGSTFEVLLPKYTGGGGDGEAGGPTIQTGTGRILFVDDEADIVQLSREMLKNFGYEVVTATDGESALRLFSETPDAFDLVMTDLNMPGMSGLALSKQILAIRPGTPVLLCTGFSDDLRPEDIEKAGIRKMIQKPLIAGELSMAIHDALNTKDFR
jgi:DNA-binding response OmpR family regulator/signal transduction histidine kinase